MCARKKKIIIIIIPLLFLFLFLFLIGLPCSSNVCFYSPAVPLPLRKEIPPPLPPRVQHYVLSHQHLLVRCLHEFIPQDAASPAGRCERHLRRDGESSPWASPRALR
jgi:hypothetical protein